jgi:hypothetical protein
LLHISNGIGKEEQQNMRESKESYIEKTNIISKEERKSTASTTNNGNRSDT